MPTTVCSAARCDCAEACGKYTSGDAWRSNGAPDGNIDDCMANAAEWN
ncbi:MAG: hypothetical protein M1434_08250 [Chloroflexi bacterium]|nr:hypothetical protein [Chloroflexota bacterium]MCL5274722.1 hypothetical protein [Chloroflexota bacterium]